MRRCTLCSGMVPGPNHPECEAEYHRRVDAFRCTYCGRHDRAHGHKCDACYALGDPQYVGYPPGDGG